MEPIDLSTNPPRKPRAELAGIIFLPRSIDKARAHQAGGNQGPYNISGFTETMLDQLGIGVDTFKAAVERAKSDDEVATFVTEQTTPEKIAAWNEFVSHRQTGGGDRAAAIKRYPWLAERPDLTLAVDVLEEDDKRIFGEK